MFNRMGRDGGGAIPERNYRAGDNGDNDELKRTTELIGDIRLWGMCTGLLKDMSLGLLVGFKIPGGNWTLPALDRDTMIWNGGTDLLIGAYQTGSLPNRIGKFSLTFGSGPSTGTRKVQWNIRFSSATIISPARNSTEAMGPIMIW